MSEQSEQSVEAVPAVEPPEQPSMSGAIRRVANSGPLVEQDLLVEDVSIDGMCGVY